MKEMYKAKKDVTIKCLSCGSNMSLDHVKKIGLCSLSVFYECRNCKQWIARKDFFDGYILGVCYQFNELEESSAFSESDPYSQIDNINLKVLSN